MISEQIKIQDKRLCEKEVRRDGCIIHRKINEPENNSATEGFGVDHQPVRVSDNDMKGRM